MNLDKKSILIISPEPWSHIWVSKHHYARTLAEMGAYVVFANPPGARWGLKSSETHNVSILNYTKFIPLLRKLPIYIAQRLIKKKIDQIEKYCEMNFDVVWSFDNSVFFDFTLLRPRICISHIMDLNQDFEFSRATSTADLCFGVIPKIVERQKKYNNRSYWIRHGVNIVNHGNPVAVKLLGANATNALYAGNLAMPHIDWKRIIRACNEFLSIDFYFIGSNHDAVPEHLSEMENVFLLDSVSSDVLTSYFEAADVLFLSYTDIYYVQYASPHKLMEYLLSGKPIVSSYCEDYESLNDLIYMSKDEETWFAHWQKISNPESFKSNVLSEKRITFAQSNAYEKQIKKIAAYINE